MFRDIKTVRDLKAQIKDNSSALEYLETALNKKVETCYYCGSSDLIKFDYRYYCAPCRGISDVTSNSTMKKVGISPKDWIYLCFGACILKLQNAASAYIILGVNERDARMFYHLLEANHV